jgi:hypothetical protein
MHLPTVSISHSTCPSPRSLPVLNVPRIPLEYEAQERLAGISKQRSNRVFLRGYLLDIDQIEFRHRVLKQGVVTISGGSSVYCCNNDYRSESTLGRHRRGRSREALSKRREANVNKLPVSGERTRKC